MRPLERISCVEDDADVRAIAQIVLTDLAGFEVQFCASGAEAIEQIPGFDPDLILLDVVMPGMDGLSTLEALRSIRSLAQTPVIFVTGDEDMQETDRYRSAGAIGVVGKPFDPVELPLKLRQLWSVLHEGNGR